jgi:hypothetical protein
MGKIAVNDSTGDRLISRALSKEGEANWDLIFGKKKEPMPHDEFIAKMLENPTVLAEYELDKSTGEIIRKTD